MHMQSGWGQPGERFDLPFEQLKEERVILGSPRQCADEIVSQHKEFGAEFMAFRVYTPGMEPSRGLNMVEQLGKDVLPLVRQEAGVKSLFE
jgi:alkanesulfonate monooxygenase SsuD/methylene tetrahydromethanopterin reductase-like flavin-dependent oxidoreductase (luciferase family)